MSRALPVRGLRKRKTEAAVGSGSTPPFAAAIGLSFLPETSLSFRTLLPYSPDSLPGPLSA